MIWSAIQHLDRLLAYYGKQSFFVDSGPTDMNLDAQGSSKRASEQHALNGH